MLPTIAYRFTIGLLCAATCIAFLSCDDDSPTRPSPVPRGDIDNNGTPCELADAVLFCNYFVFGDSVFDSVGSVRNLQIAASDVNNDHQTLTIADLVCLLRVITGDALPVPPSDSVSAQVIYEGSVIIVNKDMGAAYVVVEGNVTPVLLIDGVEIRYAFDSAENVTRVLIVGFEQSAAINGTFLNAGGTIVSAEMATYEGAPLASRLVPLTFVLYQNFPEPFTSTTTIGFAVGIQTSYTITITNFLGQVIEVIRGTTEPGSVSLLWDGSDFPPGVYFYRVEAGPYRATKAMTLVRG